jgi:hypothetical protein
MLVVVVAALVEVAMLGFDQLRLWHAAREAARTAVVNADEHDIRSAAERSGLDGLELSVSPDTPRRTFGAPLSVHVTYSPEGTVPVIGSLFEGLTLEARATMRIERP